VSTSSNTTNTPGGGSGSSGDDGEEESISFEALMESCSVASEEIVLYTSHDSTNVSHSENTSHSDNNNNIRLKEEEEVVRVGEEH
jgi:hypothetical protein